MESNQVRIVTKFGTYGWAERATVLRLIERRAGLGKGDVGAVRVLSEEGGCWIRGVSHLVPEQSIDGPAGFPPDGAQIGHRVRITAPWLAGQTGTVTTLRIGYVRAFEEDEQNMKIVMLDSGSYVMLDLLLGAYEIVGATQDVTLGGHLRTIAAARKAAV